MRALLVLLVLLFAVLFYNRPSASRERNLAFDAAQTVTQASGGGSGTQPVRAGAMSRDGGAVAREAAGDGDGRFSNLIRSQVGYRAPDFSAGTLDGFATRSLASFQGRNVLLYVWATWCGQCQREMPSIQALYREFGAENLAIVAVEASSDIREVQQTVNERGFSFEVLRDDRNRTTFRNYLVPGYPYTAIINREGVVRAVRIGYDPENHLRNVSVIRELLSR
jgi:peroxiredoxin